MSQETDKPTPSMDGSECRPPDPPMPSRRIVTATDVHVIGNVATGEQTVLATVMIDNEALIVRAALGDARLVWPMPQQGTTSRVSLKAADVPAELTAPETQSERSRLH